MKCTPDVAGSNQGYALPDIERIALPIPWGADMDLPWLDSVQRPRKRIPSVLTVAEVAALLSELPIDPA